MYFGGNFWIRIPARLHVSSFSCLDLAKREPMVEGGIYQWSGLEKLTKWDIVQLISHQAGLRKQRLAAFRSIPSLNKIQVVLLLISYNVTKVRSSRCVLTGDKLEVLSTFLII
jgi:hypothetical protein